MRFTFHASRVLVLLVASFWVASCSDDVVTEDFAADCSVCTSGVPVGPSADEASCTAWGDEFDCATAVLVHEGLCGDPAATCQVDDCALEPVGCE